MLGHLRLRRPADHPVEPAQRGALVAQAHEEFVRVRNPPAGKRADLEIDFIPGGHPQRASVPFQNPFFETVHVLDEREFKVQSGLRDRFTDRIAELR